MLKIVTKTKEGDSQDTQGVDQAELSYGVPTTPSVVDKEKGWTKEKTKVEEGNEDTEPPQTWQRKKHCQKMVGQLCCWSMTLSK